MTEIEAEQLSGETAVELAEVRLRLEASEVTADRVHVTPGDRAGQRVHKLEARYGSGGRGQERA
jgi:hypothetical protein